MRFLSSGFKVQDRRCSNWYTGFPLQMLEHTWASLVTGGESGTEHGVVCAGLLARLLSLSFYLVLSSPRCFLFGALALWQGWMKSMQNAAPQLLRVAFRKRSCNIWPINSAGVYSWR